MSLKPNDLSAAQYPVALKPLLGYEQQLYVSTQPHTVLASIEVVGLNSGTVTTQQADNLLLSQVPQELMAVVRSEAELGSALTITVTGTDQDGGALTGSAILQPPAYSNDQTYGFPVGWAAEVTAPAGRRFKTVTNYAVTYAGTATGVQVSIVGVPTLDSSSAGTFRKIGTKTQLNYDPKVPMPTAVQDGRDKGKYIKAGEIEVGSLEISAKIPSGSDGLARINGKRVTGWVKEVKEDKLHTQNIFLLGLIMTAKPTVGEGADPATFSATSMYEIYAFIPAR
jgi:hypothetical protein